MEGPLAANTARILSLWETTIFLIKHERALGQQQQRYLAMIYDQRVSGPGRGNLSTADNSPARVHGLAGT